MELKDTIINRDDQVLVTGASGFIGTRVVASLLEHGFRRVRCFTRPSSDTRRLEALISKHGTGPHMEVIKGNLLSREDCREATKEVAVVYHLAAGTGSKSFPDAFMNSVVTTRNLLEATLQHNCLRRFVSLSSFAVYSNRNKPRGRTLDELCPIEEHPESRAEAYCFAKVKQDELIVAYGKQRGLPFVLLRPGVVYGPGKKGITGRVGIGTFGIFLHLGGFNSIPFTYVDNCAEAVVLAGLRRGVDGEVFNIVDDELPSSRRFLRLYKRNVRRFNSIYLPHSLSYLLCYLWEKYSNYSEEQLPPLLSRREWAAYWKRTHYTNEKLKRLLGWTPRVPMAEGLRLYFESCRERKSA